jgi:hypothetical protein
MQAAFCKTGLLASLNRTSKVWFFLAPSLAESNHFNDEKVRSALEQILYSVSKGEHAIAGSPSVLRRLMSIDLSPVPRAVLRR